MENKLVIGTANFGMAYGQGVNTEELSLSSINNCRLINVLLYS